VSSSPTYQEQPQESSQERHDRDVLSQARTAAAAGTVRRATYQDRVNAIIWQFFRIDRTIVGGIQHVDDSITVVISKPILAIDNAVTIRVRIEGVRAHLYLHSIFQAILVAVGAQRVRAQIDFGAVIEAIIIAICIQWIGATVHLVTVVETVIVTIGVLWISSPLDLIGVGEAVAIRIGISAVTIINIQEVRDAI